MRNKKKELIRKRATSVFAREGYHHATVDMIAEESEVSVGTLYNYFDNKQDILEYVFEIELNKRLGWLQELKRGEGSLRSKFVSFMDRHFNELKSNPDTTTVLMQESRPPSKHSFDTVKEFMNKLPALFAELIEEAKEEGEVRDIDSQLVSTAIFEALHGISEKVVYGEDYDFNCAKKEVVNFYWLGLKK